MIELINIPEEINGVKVVNQEATAINELALGRKVARFEFGDSMFPLLKNGEYAIITPKTEYPIEKIKVGDIVFCNLNGCVMTHLVSNIHECVGKTMFQISSTNGVVYGWTDKIYGVCEGTDVIQEYRYVNFMDAIEKEQ